MATTIFGAVGTAIGGPVGGAIGSLLGALVDQALFAPDVPKPDGPGSLESGRGEGAPVSWGVGSEVILEGTWRYASPITQVEVEEGGKGGDSKSPVVSYRYKADVAIALMKGETESLGQLWLGGDLWYDSTSDVQTTFSSGELTIQQTPIFGQVGDTVPRYYIVELVADEDADDLDLLVTGYEATLDVPGGGSRYPITGVVTWTYRNSTGETFCRIKLDTTDDPGFNESSPETIGFSSTVTQALPDFSPGNADAVTYYTGSATQDPDPVLEARLGVGNVPRWRGWSYIVIKNLDVTKWGASLPSVRARVIQNSTADLADVVSGICLRNTKIEAGDIDVTALEGIACNGISGRGPTSARTMLTQLAITHNLEAQEKDGKIVFFTLDNADEVEVTDSDWGAVPFGGQPNSTMPRKTRPLQSLPSGVSLTFYDPFTNYNPANAEFHYTSQPVTRTAQLRFDMVLTRTEAQAAAKRLAVRALLKAEEFEVSLPPNYIRVLEGDLVTVTEGDDEYAIRANQVERGDNGQVVVTGPRELVSTLSQDTYPFESIIAGGKQLLVPRLPLLLLADLPPQSDDQVDVVGVYSFMGRAAPGDPYSGAVVFRSTDGGSVFSPFAIHPTPAVFMLIENELGDGDPHFIDNANTITVELLTSSITLSSADPVDVYNGTNNILIGRELVGFTTVDALGDNRYTLSGLFRGLRGTDDATALHFENETGVLFTSSGVFTSVGVAALGESPLYKGVPSGGVIDDYDDISQEVVGRSVTPFNPYNVQGSRDGSNNLTVTWSRRSRIPHRGIAATTALPLDESQEEYGVDVLDGSTVVRTISVSSATASYTAAQQTTDGLTPGDPVTVRVYQIGGVVGRGRVTEATI